LGAAHYENSQKCLKHPPPLILPYKHIEKDTEMKFFFCSSKVMKSFIDASSAFQGKVKILKINVTFAPLKKGTGENTFSMCMHWK